MELAKNLQSLYGTNNPILLDEIRTVLKGYSKPYLYQLIREAIRKGELSRFDESVYFVPEADMFGAGYVSADKIAYKKYIKNEDGIIGVYIGWKFLNGIGATTQNPYVLEIATNNESMRVRELVIGKSKFILRKPKCKITAENVWIIAILETATRFTFYENVTEAVVKFIKKNNISVKDLLTYADYYPAQTLKNIRGVLYELA